MKLTGILIFSCVLSVVLCLEKARYDNYRLYEVQVEDGNHQKLLKTIDEFPDGFKFLNTLNLWIGAKNLLVVPPHKFAEFGELTEKFNLKSQLITGNLQNALDKQTQTSKRQKEVVDWTRYWNLDEIHVWMDSLMLDFPGVVSTFSIGESTEGREIRGLRINTDGIVRKKAIFFESTIHANEWITTATTTWIINELLTSTDAEVRLLVERYEWYFVPVLNVDGFAYTFSTDRLWRKTRRNSDNNLLCHGADPNRNWDLLFGEYGASKNPCSANYAGDFAFSEPETKHFSEFVPKIPNLVGYFAFHSYGQLLMLPYAYTLGHKGNYNVLHEIGEKAVEAIKSKHGKDYNLGSVSSFFGRVSGSSFDWMNLHLQPNVSFCYEMRPSHNADGFGQILPPEEIIPNAEEVFASIVEILKESIKREIA